MTTEERLGIIRNKAKQDAIIAEQKANDEGLKREELKTQIKDLYDRIQAVLICANECVKNGVDIPEDSVNYPKYNSGEKYGYAHEFIAEGIRHHTGFIRTWACYKKGTYKYLGIENGGACGCFDFWTDGEFIKSVHEDRRNETTEPRIYDMEKFLEEFPVFEAAFYNWIDSLKD